MSKIRCRWFAPDFTHKFLIAEEMCCTPARRCAAIIGMPIGLTRNAMVRRIRPFFTEYVTRTNTPRIPTIPLTSRRKNAEKEISPKQLVDLCAEELKWKRTTTYSILKKLSEKGFFKLENSMVTSLVSKEEYNSYQSEKFVKETFHGSLPALVLSFGSRKKLDQEEIDELQKIIDSMRG